MTYALRVDAFEDRTARRHVNVIYRVAARARVDEVCCCQSHFAGLGDFWYGCAVGCDVSPLHDNLWLGAYAVVSKSREHIQLGTRSCHKSFPGDSAGLGQAVQKLLTR